MPTRSKKKSSERKQSNPHRTLRLSRRRDYLRPLVLPGVFSFTYEVTKTLWQFKKIFLWLVLIYVVLYGVLVGLQSQDTYRTISQAIEETGAQMFDGTWGVAEQTGGIFLSIATAGINSNMTEAQQIFSIIIFLLIWLTTVWLLRNLLVGNKVRLRDGLYNAGAPIVAMVIVALVMVVQLIPIAIAFIGYSAALTSGLLAGGAPTMLFWLAAVFLGVLSLYWITSSLLAMIIVTIPGMYPMKAIKSANELIFGRRLTILFRWLWMVFVVLIVWSLLLLIIILFDMWVKSMWSAIEWLPIVPFATVVLSALSTVWISAYVYLLYRKVVDYVPEN